MQILSYIKCDNFPWESSNPPQLALRPSRGICVLWGSWSIIIILFSYPYLFASHTDNVNIYTFVGSYFLSTRICHGTIQYSQRLPLFVMLYFV